MPTRLRCPIALTVAGSDSGGGAGVQADLKVFAALGVHGTCAITCLTAQNPSGVRKTQPTTPRMLRAQFETVCDAWRPSAVKTGMLHNLAVVEEFLGLWLDWRWGGRPPLVVDPVMMATSGARLLAVPAMRLMRRELLALATLVTPNLDEAEWLLDRPLRSLQALRDAARALHERHGCAALVKGGHLRGGRHAVDFFFDGRTELMLSAPRIRGVRTHGTGCTYSAAITALLGRGAELSNAAAQAKQFVTLAIARSWRAGRHDVLNPMR